MNRTNLVVIWTPFSDFKFRAINYYTTTCIIKYSSSQVNWIIDFIIFYCHLRNKEKVFFVSLGLMYSMTAGRPPPPCESTTLQLRNPKPTSYHQTKMILALVNFFILPSDRNVSGLSIASSRVLKLIVIYEKNSSRLWILKLNNFFNILILRNPVVQAYFVWVSIEGSFYK